MSQHLYNETTLPKKYWWDAEKDKANQYIFPVVRHLMQNQGWIREGHLRNMRLYGNLNVLGLSFSSYGAGSAVNPPYDRLGLNVVQSCVDTLTQKIAKNKPKPMFLTEGGNWSLQRKAKKLNKFIDGQFYESRVYETTPDIARDAFIFGDGYCKVFLQDGNIKIERVFPGEIVVDENDGVYGKPRSMFQTKYLPKEYVMAIFPEYADKIAKAPLAEAMFAGHKSMSDYIYVVEAWHLASGDDAKDGRHVICIDGCDLHDDEYNREVFPIKRMSYSKRVLGYSSQGLAEQLTGIQVEINKILRDIQNGMHLQKPKYLFEYGSKIIKSQVDNTHGGFLWYSGTKPELYTPPAVNPQWFAHMESLYQKAFQVAGISQLSAQSTKPAGLNSGKALREYNDIETERFILIGQMWEQFHLDIASEMIDLIKSHVDLESDDEKKQDYEVMAKNKNTIEIIKWSEVDMKEDKYMMHLYPTSALSKNPAMKIQDVVDLMQAGIIGPQEGSDLLDFPDLEAHNNLKNAPINNIKKQIEMIIDEGKYQGPEPFQNLNLGVQMMSEAYLQAKNDNVPESRLELMRRWVENAKMMMATAQAEMMMVAQQQAMAQMQQGQQGMPAGPEPMPTNPMIPQGVG
jgi:hypothetical protein